MYLGECSSPPFSSAPSFEFSTLSVRGEILFSESISSDEKGMLLLFPLLPDCWVASREIADLFACSIVFTGRVWVNGDGGGGKESGRLVETLWELLAGKLSGLLLLLNSCITELVGSDELFKGDIRLRPSSALVATWATPASTIELTTWAADADESSEANMRWGLIPWPKLTLLSFGLM